jgi:hypothetical protein
VNATTKVTLPKSDTKAIPLDEKPIETWTVEERDAHAAELAKAIMQGGQKVFKVSSYAEQPDGSIIPFSLNVRVPNLGDDTVIAQLMVMSYTFVGFEQLSNDERAFARARATLEWLGCGPYEDWVPLDDEQRERDGVKDAAPDFSKGFPAQMRSRLQKLYREYLRVTTRFQ